VFLLSPSWSLCSPFQQKMLEENLRVTREVPATSSYHSHALIGCILDIMSLHLPMRQVLCGLVESNCVILLEMSRSRWLGGFAGCLEPSRGLSPPSPASTWVTYLGWWNPTGQPLVWTPLDREPKLTVRRTNFVSIWQKLPLADQIVESLSNAESPWTFYCNWVGVWAKSTFLDKCWIFG